MRSTNRDKSPVTIWGQVAATGVTEGPNWRAERTALGIYNIRLFGFRVDAVVASPRSGAVIVPTLNGTDRARIDVSTQNTSAGAVDIAFTFSATAVPV